MNRPLPLLGLCTPHLVDQSLVGYFGPCLSADPQVVAEVIGGACNLSCLDALNAISKGRLPSVNGHHDEVEHRTEEYAVQFVFDCAKILSIRAIVLGDPVAAEALARCRRALAYLIAGAVPISPFAEQMLNREPGKVKSLAVRISEKLARPDFSGVCVPHDHDHLLIHPPPPTRSLRSSQEWRV